MGISAIRILLSALARGGSAPIRSKMISSEFNYFTLMSAFSIKALSDAYSRRFDEAVKLAGCSNVATLKLRK